MAYRAGFYHASIHIAEFDDAGRLVRSVPLALRHPRGSYSVEDPRLSEFRGGLRVFFYGSELPKADRTTMLYADVSDDLKAGPVREPKLHGRTEPKEKNWSPFEYLAVQYAVYKISPHVIVRIEGEKAERVHITDTPFAWSGGHLRGGAAPVRVGDRFYHWFHGAAGPQSGLHYNVGCYVFEAKPPFRVLGMTPAPLLWGDRNDNVTRDRGPHHAVVFPCGAYLEGNDFDVSMGWNDKRIMRAVWDAAIVDAALRTADGSPLPPPPPQLDLSPALDLPGWCTEEKARAMSDLVLAERPRVCVEIGVYGGRSLAAVAFALRANGSGVVYGIDPYSRDVALAGMEGVDKEHPDWWGRVDLEAIYQGCRAALDRLDLSRHAELIRATSAAAAASFDAGEIDILHVDGAHSTPAALRDLTAYLPLVRAGGWVFVDDTHWDTVRAALPAVEAVARLVTDGGTWRLYRKA